MLKMNNDKKLELVMKWIIKFETNKSDEELEEKQLRQLFFLITNDIDTYIIRDKYKKILEQLHKYSNNYYSKICIALNVLHMKKDKILSDNKSNLVDLLYNIEHKICGTLTTKVGSKSISTNVVTNNVNYFNIDYGEATGKNTTKKLRKKLIKTGNIIANDNLLDIEAANKWLEDYEKYVIKTYGRWSKEFEHYMINTNKCSNIMICSPNILLKIIRITLKETIETLLQCLI